MLNDENVPMADAYTLLLQRIEDALATGQAYGHVGRLLTFLARHRTTMRIMLTQAGQTMAEAKFDDPKAIKDAANMLRSKGKIST